MKKSSLKGFHTCTIQRAQLSTIHGGGSKYGQPICQAMYCYVAAEEPSSCGSTAFCRCEPIDPLGTSGVCVNLMGTIS